jgi:hypothetical protein
MFRVLFKLSFVLLVASCQSNTLKLPEWVLGEWRMNIANGNFKEQWAKLNDSTYIGYGFAIENNDTVFREHIRLKIQNTDIYYIVRPEGQNDNKDVSFKLIKADNMTWVFENKQHDFPNKIIYHEPINDTMRCEINGMKEGKFSREAFTFVKNK